MKTSRQRVVESKRKTEQSKGWIEVIEREASKRKTEMGGEREGNSEREQERDSQTE